MSDNNQRWTTGETRPTPPDLPNDKDTYLSYLMAYPIGLELNSRGALVFPDDFEESHKLTRIMRDLPLLPQLLGTLPTEDKRKESLRYQLAMVKKFLPPVGNRFDEKKLDYPLSELMELKSYFSELGPNARLLMEAGRRYFQLTLESYEQWGKYSVTPQEVADLSLTIRNRREISVQMSNFETSREYQQMDRISRLKGTKDFLDRLDGVTGNLYKILHLGANYLTEKELDSLNVTSGGDKRLRRSLIEERLIAFRRSELSKWREQRENYALPRPN